MAESLHVAALDIYAASIHEMALGILPSIAATIAAAAESRQSARRETDTTVDYSMTTCTEIDVNMVGKCSERGAPVVLER